MGIMNNIPHVSFLTDAWQDLSHYAVHFPEKATNGNFEQDIKYLMEHGKDKKTMINLFDEFINKKNNKISSISAALFERGTIPSDEIYNQQTQHMRGISKTEEKPILSSLWINA